jgi:hypothetical protein
MGAKAMKGLDAGPATIVHDQGRAPYAVSNHAVGFGYKILGLVFIPLAIMCCGSCLSANADQIAPTPFVRTALPPADHPDPEEARACMLVLDALQDRYNKGAAWEPVQRLLRVTVFTKGESLPEDLIDNYRRLAEAVMVHEEVTVEIVLDPGEPPTETQQH